MSARPFVIPLALFGAWTLLSSAGLVNTLLLPSPAAVFAELLRPGTVRALADDVSVTLARLSAGFAAGGIIGISVGVAMGRSRHVYDYLDFSVDVARSIPVASLFPLFVVFLGIGDLSKIAAVTWSTSFIALINTLYGVHSVSPIREMYAKSLGASKSQILLTIVLPSVIPSVIAALRAALSIGLIVVILTEMFLGTSGGLGQTIFESAMLYKTNLMYLAIIVSGILGFALNRAFIIVEHRLLRWKLLA